MTTDLVVSENHGALREMVRDLRALSASDDQGSSSFVMDLMDRILSADTVDAVFDAQDNGMVSGQDFTSRPFIVRRSEDIQWRLSTKDNGFPFYAIFRAVEVATGEEVVLNCGGQTFVAVLYALQQRGYFENQPESGNALVIISNATSGPNGNEYLTLRPFKRPESARGKK